MAAAGTAVPVTTTDPASASPVEGSGAPATGVSADGGTAAGGRVPGGRLLVVLAALTLLLSVTAVVLAVQLRGYDQDGDARVDALQAGRQFALNLTAVDTEDYEGDVEKVKAGATGEFLADFEARTADDAVRDVLVENKSRSSGKIVDAGIVRSDATNATVLVAIDVTVSNTAVPDGRVSPFRMQIELEKRDGRWLTSVLEFVA